jgi:hypothetical protein
MTADLTGNFSIYGMEEVISIEYHNYRKSVTYSTTLSITDKDLKGDVTELLLTLDEDTELISNHFFNDSSVPSYGYYYIGNSKWKAYVHKGETSATISVAGDNKDLISKVIEDFSNLFSPIKTSSDKIDLKMWYRNQKPEYDFKTMAASSWEDAADNYSALAQEQVNKLLRLRPPFNSGKMILFYGPPGMGKTNLIKTLGREWRDWAEIDYIMDPDIFFENTPYLLALVSKATHSKKWSILVAEDSDEFIRADAKARTGQGMSRLLNVTDGLAGQGTNLLVLLTTNEPLSALSSAVTRPGRCIAKIEFPKLNRAEARGWAEKNDLILPSDTQEFSLAELYNMKQEQRQITLETETPAFGVYL